MGVLQDQIQAVRTNNSLTEDEKRAQIYQIKCNGLFEYIGYIDPSSKVARYLGKTFTYNGVTIIVHSVGVTTDPNALKRLAIDVTLNGTRDTFYVTNPPVLDSTGNENLLQVVGEMLASWAGA